MSISDVILIVLSTILFVWLYFRYSYGYWKNKNIPYITPITPFGNFKDVMLKKTNIGEQFHSFYKHFKSKGCKYGGVFLGTKPLFVVIDPELVKTITIKEFHNFCDRGIFHDESIDPLSEHLGSIDSPKWNYLRMKFRPMFSPLKLKTVFPTIMDCTENLGDVLDEHCKHQDRIDIKDVLGRFTMDVIGSTAFGIECNSLKNPKSDFIEMGRMIFGPSFRNSVVYSIGFLAPNLLKFFRTPMFKPKASKFFLEAIKHTVEYREKTNLERMDMMDLLIKLKNNIEIDDENFGKTTKGISFNDLAAQAFIFIVAGYESTSTTLTFGLYHIAKSRELQKRLRDEILEVLKKHDGQITYESLQDMKYLECVMNETLRMYPTLSFLSRECRVDYQVPGTNTVLKKGSKFAISIFGLHMDPEYFPNPEVFDPDRFSDERKGSINTSVYIPFGSGPRNCIGMKLGQMETKLTFAYLLKNYEFTLDPKTKEPPGFDPAGFLSTYDGSLWLRAKKINY